MVNPSIEIKKKPAFKRAFSITLAKVTSSNGRESTFDEQKCFWIKIRRQTFSRVLSKQQPVIKTDLREQ